MNKKEEIRKIYELMIVKQFIESGEKDVTSWLNSQEKARLFYKKMLELNGIIINNPTTLEFDKGILDSISEKSTTIVSPYSSTFKNRNNIFYKPRNSSIYDGKEWQVFDTIITQNPYPSMQELDWLKVYSLAIKTYIGIYGSITDNDKYIKTKKIENQLNKLGLAYTAENATYDNYYAKLIKINK